MPLLSFRPLVEVDTNAYASGDSIGGLLLLNRFCGTFSAQGKIDAIRVIDKAAKSSPITLVFFAKEPTASTITDNLAVSIDSSDVDNVMAIAKVEAVDYTVIDGVAYATVTSLNLPYKMYSNSPLAYLAIVSGGAVTFSNASDLSIEILVEG